jgi:hypothetical protein
MYEYAYAVLTNNHPDFAVIELVGFPGDNLESNRGDLSDPDITPDLTDLANMVGTYGWRMKWIVSNGTNPVAYFERQRVSTARGGTR